MEGVQHNTYDVEFYGPNPMCGIYYLGALRACEEMARAAGDTSSAETYKSLFEQGRRWTDANLFNGEYYIQKVRGFRKDEIASNLRSDMGSENTENPEYQVGGGCLADQLIGQYLAEIGGMSPLVSPENIRKTLRSIYKYNYKPTLADHDNVERTYALNDEAAVVICDYGKAERPRIPFPYYAEAWTGEEYLVAALMMNWGMVKEGVECVENIRSRYDGEKRNPWDEPECGHHYARAMVDYSCAERLPLRRRQGVRRCSPPGCTRRLPMFLVDRYGVGHVFNPSACWCYGLCSQGAGRNPQLPFLRNCRVRRNCHGRKRWKDGREPGKPA
jgi:uncharacterized protein (DUF608 family)